MKKIRGGKKLMGRKKADRASLRDAAPFMHKSGNMAGTSEFYVEAAEMGNLVALLLGDSFSLSLSIFLSH